LAQSSILKGVILTCTGVVAETGFADAEKVHEIIRLLNFVEANGLQPVVLSNTKWNSKSADGTLTPLREIMQQHVSSLHWYCCNEDPSVPSKPHRKATEYVRQQYGWAEHEVIYIGNSQQDMRTAVNGGLLFLNAIWYEQKTDYGFVFESPKDLAKFIDIFCLREHWWEFEIHDNDLDLYALSTFSTFKHKYAMTSSDARAAAKYGQGHLEFWARYLVSSLYFSGVYDDVDYITPYPGHKEGVGNADVGDAIAIFANCFRKKYLSDLIVRHKNATKSQTARNQGLQVDHLNQINTIHLTQTPTKSVKTGKKYVQAPLRKGKNVLVVDDICTQGNSLEAARSYIESTGSKVILLSWLKTINTGYCRSEKLKIAHPYAPCEFESCATVQTYGYHEHIVDSDAQSELHEKLSSYDDWDWPD